MDNWDVQKDFAEWFEKMYPKEYKRFYNEFFNSQFKKEGVRRRPPRVFNKFPLK